MKAKSGFFRDEEGFTTVAMALSLLLSLALVFTGAQVYRMESAAAEVQEVADAAVLSAENQVAEFTVIAQFCDATVLSLSLTSLAAAGLGVAALCVPAAFPLSEGLLKAARSLMEARDAFAQKAALALNRLQEALPFLCAACAAAVAQGNDGASAGAQYMAAAILVPSQGEFIRIADGSEALEALDGILDEADDVRAKAQEAEDASRKANEAKERAFMRDCGDNPSYCMYERAQRLASMEGDENPLYSSIDTWSFSVPLERARIYYQRRLDSESPDGSSVEARARSALRADFYRFAVSSMASAYVHETEGGFDANFPRLPHNTEQMRSTDLYTDPIYPITVSGTQSVSAGDDGAQATRTMHAWAGCPKAAGATATGSIQQMEQGGFETCSDCGFKASSLGKVAAASTSIDNGFEYHYEAVADEAEAYERESAKAEQPKRQVRQSVQGFLNQLGSLIRSFADARIDVDPPGRFGAIAFVVNAGSFDATRGLGSGFVSGGSTLGPRAALSAATLVGEWSDQGRNALNSLLDGIRYDGGALAGAAGIVVDAWGALLESFNDTSGALVEGIGSALDRMPLVGESGLGSWVSGKLRDLVESLGFGPIDLRAQKAVLVNSSYVAEADESGFGVAYTGFKAWVIQAASGADDLFSMVLSDAEREALEQVQAMGDAIDLGSIELLGPQGPSIPITLPLPAAAKEFGVGLVQQLFDRIRALRPQGTGQVVWR